MRREAWDYNLQAACLSQAACFFCFGTQVTSLDLDSVLICGLSFLLSIVVVLLFMSGLQVTSLAPGGSGVPDIIKPDPDGEDIL